MGAWGVGVFEDDTACDLLYDAQDDGVVAFIEDAAQIEIDQYIEQYDAHKIIVSATLLDTLLNGVDHGYPAEGFSDWLTTQRGLDVARYKADIVTRLQAVLTESELSELWEESGADFPEWQATIESLLKGLGEPS